MKQQLRFIAVLSAIALSTLTATAQVEVYPFVTWSANKSGSGYTSAKGSSVTSTSGKTVYLDTATFNGYSLNNRIAFEDGAKLKADKGLVISGNSKTVSIQGLQKGDIVKTVNGSSIWYISSKNASFIVDGNTTNITTDATDIDNNKLQSGVCYTITDGNSLDFYINGSGSKRLNKLTIVRPQITLGTTGYATYSNLTSTDFVLPDGLAAYTVSHSDEASDEVTLTRTDGIIPAGAGVILKGTANTTYTFMQSTASTTVADNLMVAVEEDQTLKDSHFNKTGDTKVYYDHYLLATDDDGKVGFYKSSGTGTLAAGKSYLNIARSLVSVSSAKLNIVFDNNTATGISAVADGHKGRTLQSEYNLAGQRVGKGYHGIVIVNGKKIIRK